MADPNNLGNFFDNLTTSMITVIISLIGFWTGFIKNLVSRKEVEHMIETQSPYSQDRQFIMERLNSSKESQAAFANALQKNTEVMNELKIQLVTLGKTLEALEERIERA